MRISDWSSDVFSSDLWYYLSRFNGDRDIMLQYNDFSALGIDEEVSGKCVMADFSRDPDRDKPSQPTEMHEALLCGIGRLIFSWGKLEIGRASCRERGWK